RGILAWRLQLGEARLPLAHLVPLQLEKLLVLTPGPLVVGQPAALRIEGHPGLVALRLDLLEARGMLLCLLREVADLEIDLLQLFQCPQLVTRHVASLLTFRTAQAPPPGGEACAPPSADLSTPGVSAKFLEWARQDSNLHATGYEPAALAVELRARAHGRAHSGAGE